MFSKQCKECSLKYKILEDAQSNDFKTKHKITVYKQTLCRITWFFWKSTPQFNLRQKLQKKKEKKTCLWSENTPFLKAR